MVSFSSDICTRFRRLESMFKKQKTPTLPPAGSMHLLPLMPTGTATTPPCTQGPSKKRTNATDPARFNPPINGSMAPVCGRRKHRRGGGNGLPLFAWPLFVCHVMWGIVSVDAVFTPANRTELDRAVAECLWTDTNEWLGDGSWCDQEIDGDGAIGEWDVSKVTDFSGLFKDFSNFNQDLSKWIVSQVTDLSSCFAGARAFNSDLSTWDVSKVTTLESTFKLSSAFNSDLSTWDVSKVGTLFHTFDRAIAFNSNLSTWNVSNVFDMSYTFGYYADLGKEVEQAFTSDLSKWDVSKVIHMDSTFYFATSFTSDLSKWDVSKVNKLDWTFAQAHVFNSDLSKWMVSKVTSLQNTFFATKAFNSDLSKWDLSKVIHMDNST